MNRGDIWQVKGTRGERTGTNPCVLSSTFDWQICSRGRAARAAVLPPGRGTDLPITPCLPPPGPRGRSPRSAPPIPSTAAGRRPRRSPPSSGPPAWGRPASRPSRRGRRSSHRGGPGSPRRRSAGRRRGRPGQERRCRPAPLRIPYGEHHVRPRTRQRVRRPEADAAVGAGDDRRVAGQVGEVARTPRLLLGLHHGDLRSALLAAAERTLREKGGAPLSLRELAREVGGAAPSSTASPPSRRTALCSLCAGSRRGQPPSVGRPLISKPPTPFSKAEVRIQQPSLLSRTQQATVVGGPPPAAGDHVPVASPPAPPLSTTLRRQSVAYVDPQHPLHTR